MKYYILILFAFISLSATSQKQKKQDISAIKSMCGCYEISFNFSETFSPVKDYEYHDNYKSGALEYVFPIEESKDKIVLQHLLVISDTMIIKHWRQDWLFENNDFYAFDKESTWDYKSKSASEVKGQWTQKVYQVDDSPRYEGSSSWVHVDGRHFWENTADAPLPRREFSKRSDYNVMERRNRQEITGSGWVHEQDNAKIIRSEEGDEILAYEKGLNTYTKTEDSKCNPAKKWWGENEPYWADVRAVWDEVFAKQKTIAINMKVDDKIMFQRLFSLGADVSGTDYDSNEIKDQIRSIINKHSKGQDNLASK